MVRTVPRLMLAGAGSGCGKTTVSCALLQALVDRGVSVAAFKCGPDYIDPMFHSHIIRAKSVNLDGFFLNGNTLRYLLAKNGAGREICVIEGVMGFYDGVPAGSMSFGSYEVARALQSPVVLVVDAKGAALSVLAVIEGFLRFVPDSGICGVILNRCSAGVYPVLKQAIRERFSGRVRSFGFLPEMPDAALESRHLGLVTAAEVEDLRGKLRLMAAQAEKSMDIDGLIALAAEAPPLSCEEEAFPCKEKGVRIAVARDCAFCFYYEDNLEALREMGAELVPFSPLEDCGLPEDVHGLYLGGGYPELYARRLSENRAMRSSVRNALRAGLPCIAECGGFMYLSERIGGHPMVGFVPGRCFDTGHLVRFGYVTLRAKRDNLLCRAGETVRAHEFHYWDTDCPGGDFTAAKANGKEWECAVATGSLYAGFPHFHFYAAPSFAVNFYEACRKEKHHDRTDKTDGHRKAQL